MRAGYRFKLRGSRTLQAHLDVFNVTNRANFVIATQNIGNVLNVVDRRDAATFLMLRIDDRPDADRAVQSEVHASERQGGEGR